MSEEPRACARLLHLCSRRGSRNSIMGPSQTTALADLPDRCAPTGFGILHSPHRFGLGLGDLRGDALSNLGFKDADVGLS